MRTTVDEDLYLDPFSRTKYLHREVNLALNSVGNGSTVTMLRRAGVEVYVMVIYSGFLTVKEVHEGGFP